MLQPISIQYFAVAVVAAYIVVIITLVTVAIVVQTRCIPLRRLRFARKMGAAVVQPVTPPRRGLIACRWSCDACPWPRPSGSTLAPH